MSGVTVIPNKKVNFIRDGGWELAAIYLEKLAKETDDIVLSEIAVMIRQLWWWIENPEAAVIALDPKNDANKSWETE